MIITKSNIQSLLVTILFISLSASLIFASKISDKIESSAKSTYVYVTYLKDDDIKINVIDDSIVRLTGTVSEWSHLALAEETIYSLPGVKQVVNNLTIQGEKPAENSDAWITMRIKSVLMFHRNVSAANTDISVKDGIVSLNGIASSQAQKELTREYAIDVDGVKSVNNYMIVDKKTKSTLEKIGDNIDDASITAQVRMALLLHRSTNVLKTKVATNNGIVTVRGNAKNGAEKDLVGKLVNNIKGVKGLKNKLIIVL